MTNLITDQLIKNNGNKMKKNRYTTDYTVNSLVYNHEAAGILAV